MRSFLRSPFPLPLPTLVGLGLLAGRLAAWLAIGSTTNGRANAPSGLARTAAALMALALALGTPVSLAQSTLPSLGDRISGTVSLDEEYQLGQQFLAQIRRSAPTIPDALLKDYLEFVTYRLASRSQLQDHRLSFVIIDSQEINAFAAPGGIIGVNTGLFLNALSEAEFASVMAHEIAHVSQRHFARGVDEANANRLPQLATLLGSIIVMATADARQGAAAITAAQGLAVDNQLRFSRSNETEADRVGQNTLFNAGFDPSGMANMFERLQAENRFGQRPPEFLLSHPLTETRIAEARGRASRYPSRDYSPSLEYQFMRARVVGHYARDKAGLVIDRQRLLESSTTDFERDANRFYLAIAHYENEDYAQATAALAPLFETYPNRITLVVTQAEIFTAQNESAQAVDFLQRHLQINPDNHPLTMAMVDALEQSRQFNRAAQMLERHTKQRPNDHHLWYQLAEVWGQAGNISKVHQARAEYFLLVGDFPRAREQLQFALRIETEEDGSPADIVRLRQKLREVEDMQRQLRG